LVGDTEIVLAGLFKTEPHQVVPVRAPHIMVVQEHSTFVASSDCGSGLGRPRARLGRPPARGRAVTCVPEPHARHILVRHLHFEPSEDSPIGALGTVHEKSRHLVVRGAGIPPESVEDICEREGVATRQRGMS